jgi:hypothetical protein
MPTSLVHVVRTRRAADEAAGSAAAAGDCAAYADPASSNAATVARDTAAIRVPPVRIHALPP